MNISYEHLFFDLDHTLWDYDQNARLSLEELYHSYSLANYGKFSASELVDKFFHKNEELWALYNRGEIERDYLRGSRFKMIFKELGFHDLELAYQFGEDYVDLCPTKPALIPGAEKVLEALAPRYHLHVITNGFDDVQYVKIRSAGLEKYFKEVITSERAGARKPAPDIFHFALKVAGAQLHQSVMIGDNLTTDIAGALKAGMDHVYFNPAKKVHEEPVMLEITTLEELLHHF